MKALTDDNLRAAAKDLGVDLAAVRALVEVESRGRGFLGDGRPKILFERHVMYRRLRDKEGLALANQMTKLSPSVVNRSRGGYVGGYGEHERLDLAAHIDRDCALESASWGLFQIMGYHWKALGYPSLQAFINAMYRNEAAHLDAFVRFVKLDPALHQAIRDLDWATVARLYNGPAYAQNNYDTKLAAAYKRHAGLV